MNRIIGNNLKKLREAAGYTQSELARILGVSRYTYNNYESANREAPHDILERVSLFYGCNMELFFEENESVDGKIITLVLPNNASSEDINEIMRFKDIVRSYIKMDALEAQMNI